MATYESEEEYLKAQTIKAIESGLIELPKGDKGKDGKDGKDGVDGKNGIDGKDGLNGTNGIDGIDGVDGKDGEDGKDGSPDTGEQIVNKINDLPTDEDDLKIDAKHIKNLPEVTKTIVARVVGTGSQPVKAGTNISITYDGNGAPVINSTAGGGTPGGSDTQVQFNDAGTFGGDAGLTYNKTTDTLTSGYLALSNMTEGSVLFAGSGGVLAQDNTNYYWDDTNDVLILGSATGNQVTNGDFSSSTGWTVGSGWVITGGVASHTSNGTATLTRTLSITPAISALYRVDFTISDMTVTALNVTVAGVSLGGFTANGTYTRYITATSTAGITFQPSNTSRFSLDNVSVIRITSGSGTLYMGAGANFGGATSITGNIGSNLHTSPILTLNNLSANGYTTTRYSFLGTTATWTTGMYTGEYSIKTTGGNGLTHYHGAVGIETLASYSNGTGYFNYGRIQANSSIRAGSLNTPTSTLTSDGSLALKVTRLTANTTLASTSLYTQILADGDAASSCSGTPSTTTCSTYVSQGTCENYDSHGGCTWNAGSSCSAFDGTDESTCEANTGCTYETTSCSVFGDQSSCEATSPCTWDYTGETCSAQTNGTDCTNVGCTPNYGGDCTSFSSTDQGTCEANEGCVWSDPDCTGNYFTSCDGDNSFYSCNGDYFTGVCSGSYGAGCSGTATCTGINDSTNCGLEAGCTWSTGMTLTLPDGETCPDKTWWIKNDSSGGADITILPYSGQTIEKAASLTLPNYHDAVHIAYYKQTADCSVFNAGSQSSCETNSGCSWTGGTCESFSSTDEATCTTGHTGCSWSDPDCTGTYDEGSTCSGTYEVGKNWYIF